MIGSLVTLAIVSTPVIGLVWVAFMIWEAMDES